MFNYAKLERAIKESGKTKTYLCQKINRPAYYLRDVIKQKNTIPPEQQRILAGELGVTVEWLNDEETEKTAMSYGSTPLLDAKKAITNTDDGLNEKYAKYDVLIDLFDSLPPDRQDAVIRQLQEIVRLQKAQDDLLKF